MRASALRKVSHYACAATRRRGPCALRAPEAHEGRGDTSVDTELEEVDAEQLEMMLADRSQLMIVDFFSHGCGPCAIISEELKKAQAMLGQSVKIIKTDCEKNPSLASEMKISGLPTVVFVPDDPSSQAYRHEGLLPASSIVDIALSMQSS